MTDILQPPSWWNSSSWFAGADGLQAATAAAAAVAPGSQPPTASQPQEADTLTVVGGAKAQSRFSGKTAIPIATVTPLSIASLAKPSGGAPPQQQPSGGASLPAAAQHEAWSSARVTGRTVDGSVPPSADGGNGVGSGGPHRSRYVFDTHNWRWVHSDPAGQAAGSSDKHQLAARRWGDGRDALSAAAALQQQQQQAGGNADAAAAAPAAPSPIAAPAKRQRLQVSAMTGDSSDAGFAAVGGLQKQREALVEQVVYPLAYPRLFSRLGVSAARGVLLHGPSGSGKTHLVRALAAEAGLPIVTLNGGECVGENAEKNMRRAFSSAKSQAPCILFLDELDALAPSRQHSNSEHERQATARLLAAVDELRRSRCRVGLVGATNRRSAVDSALRRAGRLDSEVAFAALHQQERLEVLRCCTQRMPLQESVELPAVAAQLRGYVAADVAAVCTEAALMCAVEAVHAAEAAGQVAAVDAPEFLASLWVGPPHFEAAVARLGPAVLRGLAPEIPEISFEQIGGLQEAKAALRELVDFPLTHGDLLAAYGLPAPRGALLYGPPGCGKTLLAKAAAAQCGANFLSVRGPELLQKWLGESEAAVRQVFETARQAAPCLIFFDEIDSIACRRGGGSSGTAGDATSARVLNQLLVEMDGMADRGGVFVLCATNRPEALDPALTRPGRLDHLLRVPLPDTPARLQILASALRRCPLDADVALASLAEGTEGMSGADLAEVCRRAGMAAIRELVAAEEQHMQRMQDQQQGSGGSSSCGSVATELATAPLQQRHLAAALASMRRSVTEEESQRHARIEQQLAEGSLPAPAEEQQEQQQVLRQVVQQAVQGSVERQLSKLQLRVQQLEAFVQGAGLELPPPAATP